MWKHIDFTFVGKFNKDSKYYLNPKQQIMFEQCLADIIFLCRPYIKRKFYLYEPNPHCFLAIELTDKKYSQKIRGIVLDCIQNYSFIKSAELSKEYTTDADNGEDFLIILDAFTDAYLLHRKSKLTHIIHCCMEFIHQSRDKELFFYQKMLALYGGEEFR